jgi:hypothetical protein
MITAGPGGPLTPRTEQLQGPCHRCAMTAPVRRASIALPSRAAMMSVKRRSAKACIGSRSHAAAPNACLGTLRLASDHPAPLEQGATSRRTIGLAATWDLGHVKALWSNFASVELAADWRNGLQDPAATPF